MALPPMPEYKENHITLWRNGTWVQVHLDELPKIIEKDNRQSELTGEEIGTKYGNDVPVGA